MNKHIKLNYVHYYLLRTRVLIVSDLSQNQQQSKREPKVLRWWRKVRKNTNISHSNLRQHCVSDYLQEMHGKRYLFPAFCHFSPIFVAADWGGRFNWLIITYITMITTLVCHAMSENQCESCKVCVRSGKNQKISWSQLKSTKSQRYTL